MVKLKPFVRYRIGKILEYGLLFQGLTIIFSLIHAITDPVQDGGSFHWNPSYKLAFAFLPGIFIGFFDVFAFNWYFSRMPFWITLVVRTLMYTLILAVTVLLFISNIEDFRNFLLFYSLQIFIILGFLQIKKAVGKGRLVSFVTGKYRHPTWEENILMFVDLNASTTIAEVLDSQKYSEFIRDFVADLSDPIYRFEGQILQYVGDEIIVYWPLSKKKHRNTRPVRCFVSMMNIIERNKAYYKKKYGFLPEFKAGLHGGELIVAELGVLKKEIAFLGDVVNTTARIQAKCADLNTNFLMSEYIIEQAELSPEFVPFSEGLFQLKGKNEKIELFSVEKEENAWKRKKKNLSDPKKGLTD